MKRSDAKPLSYDSERPESNRRKELNVAHFKKTEGIYNSLSEQEILGGNSRRQIAEMRSETDESPNSRQARGNRDILETPEEESKEEVKELPRSN